MCHILDSLQPRETLFLHNRIFSAGSILFPDGIFPGLTFRVYYRTALYCGKTMPGAEWWLMGDSMGSSSAHWLDVSVL